MMSISTILRSYEQIQSCWKRAVSERWYRLRLYSLIFLLVFMIAYWPFISNFKSFVWTVDGVDQMLPWLAYTGRWVRRIVSNFAHGIPEIPLYDLSLGWGDDIIGFLGANGQFDPISLILTALVPTSFCEVLYTLLAVVRLYLAGLAFLCLCEYFGKTLSSTFIGCLVYLFNAYALYVSTGVPIYANMMILFPLLIVETEKILNKKKTFKFTILIFITALFSFYYLYMASVAIIVYGLVRFFSIYGKGERTGSFLIIVGSGISAFILGLMLAAPVALPSVFALFGSARSGHSALTLSSNIGIHWKYFWMRLMSFVAPKSEYVLDWALDFPTLAAIFLPLVGFLFSTKGRKSLKWLMSIAMLVLFCPLGGWAMNGFQYVCNRWVFAFTLLAAYLIADCLPDFLTSKKRTLICISAVCCYAVAGLLSPSARTGVHFWVGLCTLSVTGIAVFISQGKKFGNLDPGIKKMLCWLLVVINIFINNSVLYSKAGADWIVQFMDAGRATEQFESYMDETAADTVYSSDGMDGRYDSSTMAYNGSLYTGVPGTSVYTSTANGNVVDYWVEMEGVGNVQNFKTYSTDQRTIFNELLSVKWQIEDTGRKEYVPFGYEATAHTKAKTGQKRDIYENRYALPWGYTYEKSVGYDALEELNGIEKQEVLMQAVALDDDQATDRVISLDSQIEQIPYSVECTGCSWENGILKTGEGIMRMRVNAEFPAGKECYIRLRGFSVDGNFDEVLAVNPSATTGILVLRDKLMKTSRAHAREYPWYYGREDYLFSLGVSEKERDYVTINVPLEGEMKLEDIELYALPLDHYPEQAEALRKEPLENITMAHNAVTGTVTLSKDKYLCLSIPFSRGWTAFVDGEKQEILRANYAFMGLKLTEGHHTVEFRYFSPGLNLGIALCLASVGILTIQIINKRKKRV